MEYTKEDIEGYLEAAHVCYGIKEARIAAIIKKKLFRKEILIAEGTRSVDGVDGYFEYFFDEKPNLNKPLIREDGTVDYTAMNVIRCVRKGDIIAAYHPARLGSAGRSTKDEPIKPRPARDLLPYNVKGVSYSEKAYTYTADRSGRVELSKSRIAVEDVQEFYRNIDNVYGNIDFYGDVVIHGNVKSGVSIKASKSVTIDGTLEGSDITAGEDIIVKGGIFGSYSSRIKCEGNLYADFVEYAKLDVDGDISVNSFLDCEVTAKGRINATGKLGAIIGGNVFALRGIECIYAGNDAQVKTILSAGVKGDMLQRRDMLEKRIKLLMAELTDFRKRNFEFERLSKLGTIDEVSLGIWKNLQKNNNDKTQELVKSKTELNILNEYIGDAADPHIIARNTMFTGCIVQLGSQKISIHNDINGADFLFNRSGQMVMRQG